MKNRILSLLIFSFLIGLSACSGTDNTAPKENSKKAEEVTKRDVRESVWNQLSVSNKDRIDGSWKDAKVSKLTLKPGMGKIDKGEYIGKEVYIVDFPIKSTTSNNNMLFYASIENQELIGQGYTD
ncbi:hypothetical protein [Bacillus sp. EB01]|uniref:hypothetical protein n=1 Tax=Bacillus sp. EB01 TaxID=1347086 RepID=UPI0005C6FD23|nr:hypothetical protein [Bacillus sp. EB01]